MNDAEIFAEPTGDTSNIDVDALMSQVEQPGSHEIPMSAPPEQTAPTPAPAAAAAATPDAQNPSPEYEFTWNGKKIKAPVDKLTQWASQGYDYSQKMGDFKQQQQSWEKERQDWEAKLGQYRQVDEFFAKNPDKWQKIQENFQGAQSGIDPSNPLAKELIEVKGKLSQYDKFIQDQKVKEESLKRQQDDQQLGEQMKSIRQTYKDLDFTAPDAEGKTVEYRVLEYAKNKGIRDYEAAFIAFNHDRIVKLAQDKAKEALVKETQKRTKLGLLGQSPTPKTQLSEVKNLKSKSYENILDEIKSEMGLG